MKAVISQAKTSIGELQVTAYEGTKGDNDLAIDVVNEVDRSEDEQ